MGISARRYPWGLDQVKLVAQQVKHIDLDLAWIIRYMAMESFFMSYHKSNGHYPPHRILRAELSRESSIILSLQRNLLIRQTDSRYDLADWQYIIPEKVFDPSESLAKTPIRQLKMAYLTYHVGSVKHPTYNGESMI